MAILNSSYEEPVFVAKVDDSSLLCWCGPDLSPLVAVVTRIARCGRRPGGAEPPTGRAGSRVESQSAGGDI